MYIYELKNRHLNVGKIYFLIYIYKFVNSDWSQLLSIIKEYLFHDFWNFKAEGVWMPQDWLHHWMKLKVENNDLNISFCRYL